MYIRTDPVKCFERISSRYQEGDVKITLEYLEKVHESYERYIASKQGVFIIDGTNGRTPEEIHSEIVRCLSGVLD
jgi:thymidylate kinase